MELELHGFTSKARKCVEILISIFEWPPLRYLCLAIAPKETRYCLHSLSNASAGVDERELLSCLKRLLREPIITQFLAFVHDVEPESMIVEACDVREYVAYVKDTGSLSMH